jgi:hypothetical protein
MPLKSPALSTIFFFLILWRTEHLPDHWLQASYDGNWDESSREDKDDEQAIDDTLPEQILLLDDDDDDLGATTSHQHLVLEYKNYVQVLLVVEMDHPFVIRHLKSIH